MVDDTAGTIDMSGGTVTAQSHGEEWNQQLTIGRRGIGTLNMSGGTINAENQIWLGSDPGATGIVNMTGGTINVTNRIYLSKSSGTSTEFHLDGGVVTAADLSMTANGSLDFSGGTMILDGDKEATVQEYITNGWITGHDGITTVEVNYDAGLDKTTIAADPDFNAPPVVDAGNYQSLLWPDTAQLDATVTDDGKPASPGEVTLTWSKNSGPGNVSFNPSPNVADPTATFTVAGMYELQLSATDGEKDACDVVTIHVRADNDPIAHWAFEAVTGLDVSDSANDNDGVLAGDEPNWVSGWVGDNALEFYGESDPEINSYVDITTDGAIDPNLDNLRYEISLSAWIKTTEVGNTIVTDGDNTWRMGIRRTEPAGRLFFVCNGPSGGDLDSVRLVNDDHWHHVAAVYDGLTASLYIDGVLDNSSERAGLIDINDLPITIGARYDDATTVSHSFNGLIDDVRVYGFGLSDTQVADLAAMGDLIPIVDAGENQVFSMQDGYLQLDATVTDDGKPIAATLVWSKTSGSGNVDFTDTAIEDPCVTFSEAGTYVLRLTADDTTAVVYDEVTITVEDPTCQDVIDDGLSISSDISGPDGTPDCYVDLYDFAAMAGDWLRCNNPKDAGCESPY